MSKRWMIIGGSGMLGHALSVYLSRRGEHVVATTHSHELAVDGVTTVKVDIGAAFDAQHLLDAAEPDVVVYVAGLTDVDRCEADEALAYRLHAGAAGEFALAARGRAKYVYISTDHLWNGRRPFVEESQPFHPQNAYARTKAAGEVETLAANSGTLVLRSNFIGKGVSWRRSLSDWMLENLRAGKAFSAFTDAYFTPIAMPLLCETIFDCVARDLEGAYNATGRERISKHAFALRLAEHFSLPRGLVSEGRLAEAGLAAPRPLDMSLSTEKLAAALGRPQPDLATSLDYLLDV